MISLNDIVEQNVRLSVGGRWKDAQIELSPIMPKIYIRGHKEEVAINLSIMNVFYEIEQHNEPVNRRIRTYIDDELQVLEIAWNVNPIDETIIEMVNQGYQQGALLEKEPEKSGTMIIGYNLNICGGVITLEDYRKEGFVVRNVIKLPNK